MKKITSIQVLRAIAFLEIFIHHFGYSPLYGAFGVSVFIILSGFCMGINYIPKLDSLPTTFIGSVRFSLSKIKKLYALHILMMLYRVFLLWGTPQTLNDYIGLALNVLLLQSIFPYSFIYYSGNALSWYLSTYMFICIAAPVLLRRFSSINSKNTAIKTMLIITGVMALFGFISSQIEFPAGKNLAYWFTYIFPLFRILDFSLGILLGKVFTMKTGTLKTKYSVIIALSIIVIELFNAVIYPSAPIWLQHNLLFVPGSILIIVLFAFSNEKCSHILSWQPLVWIGNLSPFAYLIHYVMMETVSYFFNMFNFKFGFVQSAPQTAVRILVTLLFTLLISLLYQYLYRLASSRKEIIAAV